MWFANQINSAYDNNKLIDSEKVSYCAAIMNDIDMCNFEWIPIGKDNAFCGCIEGNNHTIYNLCGNCGSFINNADDAIVKDLTLNINFNNKFIGCCVNDANNCYLNNVNTEGIVVGEIEKFGGLVLSATGDKEYSPENCELDYEFWDKYREDEANKYHKGTRIFNCSSNIDLSKAKFVKESEFGGIVCRVINSDTVTDNLNSVNISGCVNNTVMHFAGQNISTCACVGGIVGYIELTNVLVQINSCTNNADLKGTYAGGIFSVAFTRNNSINSCDYYVFLDKCINKGNIDGDNCGGVAATLTGAPTTNSNIYEDLNYMNNNIVILNFKGYGKINGIYAGGLFFDFWTPSNILIKCCVVYESVYGQDIVGGFIGIVYDVVFINLENSFINSNISSKENKEKNIFFSKVNTSLDKLNISNCYYNVNFNFKHSNDKSYDNVINYDCKYDDKAAYNGKLCWLLNEEGTKNYFGQVIDVLTNVNKTQGLLPDIDCDTYVYRYIFNMHSDKDEKVEGFSNYADAQLEPVNINVHDNNGNPMDSNARVMYQDGSIGYLCYGLNLVKKDSSFRFVLDEDGSKYIKSSLIKSDGLTSNFDIKEHVATINSVTSPTDIDITLDNTEEPKFDLDNKTYLISNYTNLMWLSKESNSDTWENLNNKKFKLTNDIIVDSHIKSSWIPIGKNNPFSGEIDGNNKTIDGITIFENTYDDAAFIKNAKNLYIHDLTLDHIEINANKSCSGLIFNACSCRIENVNIEGNLNSAGHRMAGFIVNVKSTGNNNSNPKTIIKDCSEKMNVVHAICDYGKVAGFIANVESHNDVDIENCQNFSDLYSNNTKDNTTILYEDWCAGIIAYCDCHGSTINVNNCKNFGIVRGDRAGGIFAEIVDECSNNQKSHINIFDCDNYESVSGTYCGGILGCIKNIKSESSIKFIRCKNCATIGLPGLVLKNVGGLIGFIDSDKLNVDIDTCINLGSVINNTNRSGVWEKIIFFGTIILDTLGAISDVCNIKNGIKAGILQVAKLNPYTFFITAILQGISSIINHIYDAVTTKMFVKQHAGGICSQFNSTNKLSVHRVINYSIVSGQTDDDNICINWDCNEDIKYGYIYAWGNNNSKCDKYQRFTDDHFKSGEVCYKLATSDKDNVGNWRQIIDNVNIGVPTPIPMFYNRDLQPDFPYDETIVYEQPDDTNNTKKYSNYPYREKNEKRDLELDIIKDSNYDQNLIDEKFNPKNFEINISGIGISKYDDLSCTISSNNNSDNKDISIDAVYKYNVYCNEKFHIQIKPTGNNTITGFKAISGKEDHTELYNIKYREDGSIDVYSNNLEENIDNFKVTYTNNKPHVHHESDVNTIVYKPRNLDNNLPSDEGNYYLTKDVYLKNEYETPSGSNKLCLDGHDIVLEEKGKIIISSNSVYDVLDCAESDDKVYFIDENLNVVRFSSDYTEEDTNKDKSANIKCNVGLIYNNSSSKDDNKAYFENNGSLNISNVSLLKMPYSSVIDINDENAKTTLDAIVCKAFDKENIDDDYLATVNINRVVTNDALYLQKNYRVYNVTLKNIETSNFGPDVKFNKKAHNIKFDTIATPVIVDSSVSDSSIVVNRDIDKWLQNGVRAENLFVSYKNKNVFSYSYDSENNVNNLMLSNEENVVSVDINKSNYGNTYPSQNVYVEKGNKLKILYKADNFSTISNINCSAINKQGDYIKEKSFDTSNNEFIFDYLLLQDSIENQELTYKIDPLFYKYSDYESNIEKYGSNMKFDVVNNEKDLPVVLPLNSDVFIYKLQSDIAMHETWCVPEGTIILDLNGHNLKMDVENKNIISINNKNSSLVVVDKGENKENNKHYFKYVDDKYIPACVNDESNIDIDDVVNPLETDENNKVVCLKNLQNPMINNGDCICVTGGLISGTNIGQHEYYLYRQQASAVNVSAGSFEIESGTIAGNNAYKVLGGAAISATEDANVNIGQNARICANSIIGDKDYMECNFAAAVTSKGKLVNNGVIDNNVTSGYAASAVCALQGYVENNGRICNNYSLLNKEDSACDSFGAVFNCSQLYNKGSIENNFSNCTRPGLYNNGCLHCGENSYISNNIDLQDNLTTKQAFDIYCTYDSNPVNFKNKINSTKDTFIALADTSKQFTNNWKNAISPAYNIKYLDLICNKVKPSNNKTLAVNNNGELQVFDKQDVVECHFLTKNNNLAFDKDLFYNKAKVGYTCINENNTTKNSYIRKYVSNLCELTADKNWLDINID